VHGIDEEDRRDQQKPGIEAKLRLRPKFRNPDYRGSGKLEGRSRSSPAATPASAAGGVIGATEA